MVAVEQFAFALLHHRLLVGLCVVMPQEVEDPVDEEQRHLIDIVPLPVYSLSTGHRRADHHVTQQHRLVPGHLGGIVYREGQDVGRTAVTVEVVVPKVCDRLFVHEVNREFYARLVEVLGDGDSFYRERVDRISRTLRDVVKDEGPIHRDEAARRVASARGIRVLAGTAERLPAQVKGCRFDVVLMNHVLEHTIDPLLALKNVVGLLKPGGTAIIDVPNHDAVGFRLAGECWRWLDVPRHLNYFTGASLEAMCRSAGLLPQLTEYRGYSRQFSQEWFDAEAQIRRAFGEAKGTSDHGGRRIRCPSPWLLLLLTAFAPSHKKYDTVRVWATIPPEAV